MQPVTPDRTLYINATPPAAGSKTLAR